MTQHGLSTAPLAFRLVRAGGGAVDNPAPGQIRNAQFQTERSKNATLKSRRKSAILHPCSRPVSDLLGNVMGRQASPYAAAVELLNEIGMED